MALEAILLTVLNIPLRPTVSRLLNLYQSWADRRDILAYLTSRQLKINLDKYMIIRKNISYSISKY